MPKLGAVRTKDVIAVAEALGFREVRQKGSHRWFRHPETGRGFPIQNLGNTPYHDEPLSRMLKQMGITKETFAELLRDG